MGEREEEASTGASAGFGQGPLLGCKLWGDSWAVCGCGRGVWGQEAVGRCEPCFWTTGRAVLSGPGARGTV